MDNLSKEKRRKVMVSIKGKNTKPEIILRKNLWSRGLRYRIHDKTIFGKPDISNKRRKLVVFVDGCFWHGCKTCYKTPTSNTEFWRNKLTNNKKRRIQVNNKLKRNGWNVLEFWEHEILKNPQKICITIQKYYDHNFPFTRRHQVLYPK